MKNLIKVNAEKLLQHKHDLERIYRLGNKIFKDSKNAKVKRFMDKLKKITGCLVKQVYNMVEDED